MSGEEEAERAERAQELRRRAGEQSEGGQTAPPSSPHEFVEEQMRERAEKDDPEAGEEEREG